VSAIRLPSLLAGTRIRASPIRMACHSLGVRLVTFCEPYELKFKGRGGSASLKTCGTCFAPQAVDHVAVNDNWVRHVKLLSQVDKRNSQVDKRNLCLGGNGIHWT
jgi:hypothetical protein